MASTNDGTIDVPPDVLRDTMSAVKTAMESSAALSHNCAMLINDLRAGMFVGPAAAMAEQTMSEIVADLEKVFTHGNWLAEHLGKSADVMESNEDDAIHAIQAVHGG